jgi:hypothetical protein
MSWWSGCHFVYVLIAAIGHDDGPGVVTIDAELCLWADRLWDCGCRGIAIESVEGAEVQQGAVCGDQQPAAVPAGDLPPTDAGPGCRVA